MESCEGDVYATTSTTITAQNERLGIETELPRATRQQFMSTFLRRTLPAQYLRRGEDKDLQYKAEILENSHRHRPITPTHSRFKSLTAKQKKELFQLNPKGHKYEDFLPLHDLWTEYMKDLMNFQQATERSSQVLGQKMLKADLHGCLLTVHRSKCPSYVGTSGIVLQESKNMFKLITKDNRVKSIPKMNSVFSVTVEGFTFSIHGNHFQFKASERAGKKFKAKSSVDL